MNEAIISLPSYSCNDPVHIQTIHECHYMQIFIDSTYCLVYCASFYCHQYFKPVNNLIFKCEVPVRLRLLLLSGNLGLAE